MSHLIASHWIQSMTTPYSGVHYHVQFITMVNMSTVRFIMKNVGILLVPWRDVQYYRRHFVQGDAVCFISFATCFVDILHNAEHTIRLLTCGNPPTLINVNGLLQLHFKEPWLLFLTSFSSSVAWSRAVFWWLQAAPHLHLAHWPLKQKYVMHKVSDFLWALFYQQVETFYPALIEKNWPNTQNLLTNYQALFDRQMKIVITGYTVNQWNTFFWPTTHLIYNWLFSISRALSAELKCL